MKVVDPQVTTATMLRVQLQIVKIAFIIREEDWFLVCDRMACSRRVPMSPAFFAFKTIFVLSVACCLTS